MSKSMENELQLALAVCGHDGLISEAELRCFEIIFVRAGHDGGRIDNAIDLFFSNDARWSCCCQR